MSSVGIVTEWFERGAGVVSRMYYDLLSRTFDVHVFGRGEGVLHPQSDWQRIPSLVWGKYDPLNPTYVDVGQLCAWVRRHRIEILLFNEQQDWTLIRALRDRLPDVRIGAYIDYYTQQTVPLFKFYDFLICNSRRHWQAFQWHPQAVFVPWGTDVQTFAPAEIRARGSGEVVFFHSCGMNPHRKGTDVVVKAFAQLDASAAARLVIHTQVALDRVLDKESQEILAGSDRITVHQRTVPAPGLYHEGDVYVYPTRLEGLGLTIFEAMASGLPVIAPDNGPMNEFIDHGRTGYLVPPRSYVARADGYYWPECLVDAADVATAMRHYVALGPELANHRRATLAHARAAFNWSDRSELSDLLRGMRLVRRDLTDAATLSAYSRWLNSSWSHRPTLAKRLMWSLLPQHLKRAIRRPKNLIST